MSNVHVFNKEEEETMEGKILNFTRTAGEGPKDGGNYLKDMNVGTVFQVRERRNEANIGGFMFEVAKHYEKTSLLAQFDAQTQTHAVQLFDQERFCKKFELIEITVTGPNEEEENDSVDGPG